MAGRTGPGRPGKLIEAARAWVRGRPPPDTSVLDQLRLHKAPPEVLRAMAERLDAEARAALVDVWPENWHAVCLFVAMATQWHWVVPPKGEPQRVGLRMESLPALLPWSRPRCRGDGGNRSPCCWASCRRWKTKRSRRCMAGSELHRMIIQPDSQRSVAAAQRTVQGLPKQVRFAASVAANQALGAGRRAVQQRMGQVFDRPTPYVVRGAVAVENTTRDKLEGALSLATTATESGNVPPGKPLLAEVKGGTRRLKRSELLLQGKGLMPRGYLTVPGRGARTDAYGNVQRGQILEILAWFQTFTVRQSARGQRNAWRDNITEAGRQRKRLGTRNRVGREYFAVVPGDRKTRLKPGIYQRQVAGRYVGPVGQRPVAVLLFVPRAQYAKRLDFVEQAEAAIAGAFANAFRTALRRALETAR